MCTGGGSGPADRDGNTVGTSHKNDSLKLLAHRLADRGFVVLRYDKRMIGGSSWPEHDETDLRFQHFVDDAVRVVTWMQEQTEVPIYLLGHSEGATIALEAASVAVVAGVGGHRGARAARGRTVTRATSRQVARANRR
ncbi:MAG: alpha/beta fold hydrolase [Gammaproteobacteria bacterium]|nr:alpha/beta fold hydrolase [Gammaproteobacteria bacterium]